MTVTVRPVPKRTYQNGIRPFRPVVPSNNIRPYTLKTWRPPVPEPLPPAPLLGPKELLLLGVAVVAQLWGRLSSRPQSSAEVIEPASTKINGTVPPTGNTAGANLQYRSAAGTVVDNAGVPPCGLRTKTEAAGSWLSIGNVASVEGFSYETGQCGGPKTIRIKVKLANGSIAFSQPIWAEFFGFVSTPGIDTIWQGAGAVAWTPATTPVPLPDGWVKPQTEPEPSPLIPQPIVPLPTRTVPRVVPQETPEPEVVPVTPGPVAPPAIRPARPIPVGPSGAPGATPKLPGATPTADGALVPQAPAKPTATQADAHFPLPGAGPVTGNGPRPTPEGIAQELGRIEQKLERLTNPLYDQPNQPDDRLKWLRDNIGNIIDFFQSVNAGSSYTLSSPCVLDANGDRIVYEVEYESALQSFGVISNKIDALAELLQVHKDLKQPNCTVKGTGQPVQVNFVQVE